MTFPRTAARTRWERSAGFSPLHRPDLPRRRRSRSPRGIGTAKAAWSLKPAFRRCRSPDTHAGCVFIAIRDPFDSLGRRSVHPSLANPGCSLAVLDKGMRC